MLCLDPDVIRALELSEKKSLDAMRESELLLRRYQEAMEALSDCDDEIMVEPGDDYDSGVRALQRAITGGVMGESENDSRYQDD